MGSEEKNMVEGQKCHGYITGNKLELYQERLLLDRRPITAQFAISDHCNLNCHYCKYGIDSERDKRLMSASDFAECWLILREIGTRAMVFSGTGEPTMNPEFPKMVEWLEANRFPYGINTNMVKGIDFPVGNARFVKVNVDGTNQADYLKRKGVDAFDHVFHNVQRFVQKNPSVKVILQCVVEDAAHAQRFYKTWRKFGLPMSLRPIESMRPVYEKENLRRIIECLTELKKKDSLSGMSYKWAYVNTPKIACGANWSIISVRPDMKVAYCCYKWDEIMGDIQDIHRIIEKRKVHRTKMNTCAVPCRLSGLNHYVGDYQTEHQDYEFI